MGFFRKRRRRNPQDDQLASLTRQVRRDPHNVIALRGLLAMLGRSGAPQPGVFLGIRAEGRKDLFGKMIYTRGLSARAFLDELMAWRWAALMCFADWREVRQLPQAAKIYKVLKTPEEWWLEELPLPKGQKVPGTRTGRPLPRWYHVHEEVDPNPADTFPNAPGEAAAVFQKLTMDQAKKVCRLFEAMEDMGFTSTSRVIKVNVT